MNYARFAGRCLSVLAAAVIGYGLVATAQAETQLGRAFRIIAGKQFVDLTHSFGPNTPVWSGFGQAKMTPAVDPQTRQPYTIAKDGFRSTYYEMVGQYGTHVDPPAHFAEDGITMDRIPLKQMVLPLVVFDATPLLVKDPNHAFSLDDLRAWEKKHGRVPKGAFAALRTDMYKDWNTDPERFKRTPFPAWSLETVKFLVEQRGVTAIGHELMDTDTTDKMEFGNLHSAEGSLSDRGHGQSRPSSGDWRTHRRGLAQGQGWFGLSRARFCHLAVMLDRRPEANAAARTLGR